MFQPKSIALQSHTKTPRLWPQQRGVRALRLAVLGAGLSVGLGAGLGAVQAQVASPAPQDPLRNVVALGASATVEVAQDWLSIVFAVTREGADPAVVQSQLRQALDAALAEARRAARPGQVEVRTGGFSLQPRYAPVRPTNGGAPTTGIVGWTGTAELVVEGRDHAAIAALPARLSGMRIARTGFSLSRQGREQVESQVTAQAIAQFRLRADEVAKAFGFAGWTLREVSVQGGEPPGVAMPMLRAQASLAMADEALPVEAGKSAVTVSVAGTVQLQ